MKTHTVVGAELVERIRFPYAVAPIVRGHHEKWNGTGYPDGLAGEQIPIGARILSAVDWLDALASDRQYRRALPLDQAIQVIHLRVRKELRSESGGRAGAALCGAGAHGFRAAATSAVFRRMSRLSGAMLPPPVLRLPRTSIARAAIW